MNISIRQIRGNSGIDVWATGLCAGLQHHGHRCSLDLKHPAFELVPGVLSLLPHRSDADVIQSNSWNGFAFRTQAPLVVTDHGVVNDPEFENYRTPLQKAYDKRIARCERKTLEVSERVVCVSRNARDCLERRFEYSDITVICNGVDQNAFRPRDVDRAAWGIPPGATVLFYSGNLSRRKGADLLPAIMDRLGEKFVLLVTNGNKGRPGNLPGSFRDLGYLGLNRLVEAYNLCDIFVIPSRFEGLSLSVLEAMACEKPVVASDCSSFPEQIVQGKGGFLCRKDDANDFADAIRHLSEDEGERKKMGVFNRQSVVDRFSAERMVKQYISLYRSL